MRVRVRGLVVAIALSGALASRSASAQEDPRKAQAEAIFTEGVKLHDAGKNAEALVRYRQAYDIYPSPNVLFGIARLEQLLGKPLDAIRHYREALKSPLVHPKNQELGKGYVAELEKQLVRVEVKAPAGTTFGVGAKRYVAPVDDLLDFEPGTISIEGMHGDTKVEGKVTGVAGSRVVLEMRAPTSAPTAATSMTSGAVPTDHVEPPPTTDDSRWGTGQTVGVIAAGAGAVAMVIGGGFLVSKGSSSDRVSALEKDIAANGVTCPGNPPVQACSDLQTKRDERDSRGAVGTGLLIGGAVVLTAGVVTFLVWPKRSSRSATSVNFVASPSSGGLAFRF
jgi:hypothetical protein